MDLLKNGRVAGLLAIAMMMLLAIPQLRDDGMDESAGPVLPGMKAALGAASRLTVSSAGKTLVMLEKKEGNWLVAEKSGYPADFENLSGLLNRLADLQIAERKTSKAENHARLGVAENGDSAALKVSVMANQDFVLLVGNEATSRGTFVRHPGENQVYLSASTIDVSRDPMDYLDPVFLDIESSDVSRVKVTSRAGELIVERDPESGDMLIQDLPEGAEVRYETIADSLARMFINLRFTDVEPYDGSRFTNPSVTSVTTSDGESLVIRSREVEGTYWAHVDEIWQYEISEYTFNELNRSMTDMLSE